MRRIGLALLVCGCAVHRESAVQVDTSLEKQTESHAAKSLSIHRIEEPSRVTTTVAEFEGSDGAGGGQVLPASPAQNLSASPELPVVLPFRGKLIKLTTTVEERGQVSESTSASADVRAVGAQQEALAAKADTEKDSKPSLGLPVLGLVLAAVAASLILTRGLWIAPLLSLAKRLFGGAV